MGDKGLDFDLTEEQTLLRNMIEKYTLDRYDPMKRLSYVENLNGFSPEGWKILADMGLLAFPFSEDLGGFGDGNIELITIMETFGRSAATEPIIPIILLAGNLIEQAGTEAQKETWLPKIIDGSAYAAFAHCEHKSRYNLDLIKTQARKKQNTHVLNGNKEIVLTGSCADIIIVSALNEQNDVALYLVKANAEGLTVRNYRLTDGSTACDLILNNVIAEPMAGGASQIKAVLYATRLAICGELLGLMELMFEDTLEHIKTRQQFGKNLGRFQAIQHRMADNYTRLELSRSHLYRAAAQDNNDPAREKSLAGAKAFISENAMALGEDAIQLHGAIGTTEELMVGQAFKRVCLLSSLFGDSNCELHRYIQA